MANPLGSAPGIVIGVGVGTAAAAAIEPAVELPRQAAWSKPGAAVRVLDPAIMARLVAQGGIDLGTAQADAAKEGYSEDKLNALVYLAQTVPGFAEAMTIWRRQGARPNGWDDLFSHAMVKGGLDQQYEADVENLFDEWLTPAQVALAIVRSLMKDPGLMPVNLDTSGGVVPAYPQSAIDPLTEALGGGVDTERLRVLVGSIGLPMSTHEAASAYFRDIIKLGDYNRSILEGDVRPEWASAILDQARAILSPSEYAELQLRGFYDAPTRRANTAKHGMSDADSDLLFDVLGRGLSEHQMVIAKARGGVYNGPTDHIPADELAALQRANLRPEYYNLAFAARYTYPSGFQIKAEAVAKVLTQTQTYDILLEVGWDPKWATVFSTAWAGGGVAAKQKKQTLSHLMAEYLSGALDPGSLTTILTTSLGYTAEQAAEEIALAEFNVAKTARTKAITALEKRFVALQLNQADATSQLSLLGLPQGAIDQLINAWNLLRGSTLTTLTLGNITTALKNNTILASEARPLLQDLGESDQAIATIFQTYETNPNT